MSKNRSLAALLKKVEENHLPLLMWQPDEAGDKRIRKSFPDCHIYLLTDLVNEIESAPKVSGRSRWDEPVELIYIGQTEGLSEQLRVLQREHLLVGKLRVYSLLPTTKGRTCVF